MNSWKDVRVRDPGGAVMEIGSGDMVSTPTLSRFPVADDSRPELGSADPPDDWLPGFLLRWVLTPMVALWYAFLFLTWLPSYLTWPWQNDSEHFALLAQLWDSGRLPYRDMFSTQFPGEIYIHYLLGKAFGWGNTVAYYAFDAALVIVFGILLTAWGRRRIGTFLPGLIGCSTFLLFYVSQNTLVAGERDWHAAFLAVCSLLLLGLGSGRTLRTVSAVAFGLALVVRPQVFLLMPALLLAIHGAAQARGESWKQALMAVAGWGVVACVVTALGFLPLVWSGILGDFLGCLKALVQPPYNRTSPIQVFLRLSPQKLPLVLLAVTALIVLLWDGTAGPHRRNAWVVLAALVGVLFYAAISPIRNAYHAIPQVAVAAIGVTYFVTQILRFGGQQTRLTVAAIALTFLFFGASAKPLSFKALRPGTETYGLTTALRVLRTGEMPPSTPLCYFSDYPWTDHRALMEYLRRHTTSDTWVANLLLDHTSAVTSEIPRLTPLPVDSNCLLMYQIPSLVARDSTALETSTEPCVVLWNPTYLMARSTEYSPLIETVRRLFQFEARFGSIEVWRRKSERGHSGPP
jgi:hypothetical protein